MKRSKKIILLCHCVINQNTVVAPLARAKGSFKVVETIYNEGYGILQLPCPEFKFLGLKRKGMNKEEYDTIEYRNLCKKLIKSPIEDIKEYIKNGYDVDKIISIGESPSCSFYGERGIFMEELFLELKREDIGIKAFDIGSNYINDDSLKEELEKFLK